MHTKKIFFLFLVEIMQAAEKVSYITLGAGHSAPLWPLISLCSMLWSFWILSHLKVAGADRAGMPGDTPQAGGNCGLQALSLISAWLQLEWGLPCLSLPLLFAHEARHLERNITFNTSITAGKKETEIRIQHSYAICYYHVVALILGDDRWLSGMVLHQRKHCLLCHWLWKNRLSSMGITESLTVVPVQSCLVFLPKHHPFSFHIIYS